ncbi:MAG: CvpA family protein [Spirochaetia bacterium]|nr:CvpA family protein [Spirochaetia bacterium]MCF7940384.1 CvpA family protein [Spirochaetia bacterium]
MTFSVLDIVSLVIIVLMALRVTFKGFFDEFMSKAGIVIGLAAALMFTTLLAPGIDSYLNIGSWSNLIAFVVLFFAGYLIMRFISIAITGILEALHLPFLDNILGFALGIIEGAVIISFMVFVLKLQTMVDLQPLFAESWVVEMLEPIAPYSIEFVKENL